MAVLGKMYCDRGLARPAFCEKCRTTMKAISVEASNPDTRTMWHHLGVLVGIHTAFSTKLLSSWAYRQPFVQQLRIGR